MNHKRKRPKSRRAGCLMCKPYKHQRAKDKKSSMTIRDRKALERDAVDWMAGVLSDNDF